MPCDVANRNEVEAVAKFAPGLADKMSAKQADRQQYAERPRNPDGTLHSPSQANSVSGQVHAPGGREKQ